MVRDVGVALTLAVLLAGCSGGSSSADAAVAPAPPLVEQPRPAPAPQPLAQTCERGGLVDAGFRDAALAQLSQLAVHAPGQPAHGAIKSNLSPGHVGPSREDWHFISAYQVNLALAEALRVAPALLPLAAEWLGWQARHVTSTGPGQGVVFDHWVRASDLQVAACPAGRAGSTCLDVDAEDSTAASLLLMADAYLAAGGDAALLREATLRAALQAAAGTLAALAQAEGLTAAKPSYPVVYLMDAAEVAAGWNAWARVQRNALGDAPGALHSLAAAQRTQDAVRLHLWHAPGQAWRVSLQAGAPDFSRWYPDTMAQAWPLLWGMPGPAAADAAQAWRQGAGHWVGERDWSRRNVDPDGFWWPAAAVAARCVGDAPAAQAWVARARADWLRASQPFAWPFQVGDLRWLFWLSDPVPASVSVPVPSSR